MSQVPNEPQPEEQGAESPAPPDELKPWYYQYWFLHPMLVFWPLWPVLIIRSPWHNGIIIGSLAWAYLITFGGLAYFRLQEGGTVALSTLAYAAPGILLTAITQAHWIKNRRSILAAARNRPPLTSPDSPPGAQTGRSRARRRPGRRARRRRQ